MIRVLLVDDDALVRSGLRMMLAGADSLEVVGEATDGREVLAAVDLHRPDVVLMDIRMPHLDGIAATRLVVAQPDPPAVIVLTTFDADEHVLRALRAGAAGFLLKDTPPTEIVAAIREVARGNPVLSPAVTRRLKARAAATDHDRRRPVPERPHGQDPRLQHPDQAGPQQPGPDRPAGPRRRASWTTRSDGSDPALAARPLAPVAAFGLGRLHLPLPPAGLLPLRDLLLLLALDPSDRPLLLLTPGVGFLLAHLPPPSPCTLDPREGLWTTTGALQDDLAPGPALGDALVEDPAAVVVFGDPSGVAAADQAEQVVQAAGGHDLQPVVGEHAPADQPVRWVDVAGGPERLQQPGGRADQGLEPPRQVGHSDGIRIHRIG
jgi:DNA-binding NarL/FixJ family response regulator